AHAGGPAHSGRSGGGGAGRRGALRGAGAPGRGPPGQGATGARPGGRLRPLPRMIPRAQAIEHLRSDPFDVVVVGGGITGAGVALDAASRGFSVAPVEKADFASGASRRSSKLVHGGLRALHQADLGLAPREPTAGYLFYDCQTDDARLVLTVLGEAERFGTVCCNWLEVMGLEERDGRAAGVRVRDGASGEEFPVRATDVVNATGVWADRIRPEELHDEAEVPTIRPSRGTHVT